MDSPDPFLDKPIPEMRGHGYYRLNEQGEPVRCRTMREWMPSSTNLSKIVKQEDVGPFWISTVFLGIDHSWSEEGPQVLWETMVFKGDGGNDCDRCSGGREQAEAMHDRMVRQFRANQDPVRDWVIFCYGWARGTWTRLMWDLWFRKKFMAEVATRRARS